MDEEILRKVKKGLAALLLAGLLIGMAFMILRYRGEMSARSRQIASLSVQASAYEAELNELRRQQEMEEMRLYAPEGPGTAVVAFLIGGEDDLDRALRYGEQYGFTPTIILRVDDPDLDGTVELLTGSGLEIILYSRGLDSAAQIKALQERLEDAGCVNTCAYLLRASDDTEANRKILAASGITTLFLYGDSLSSAVREDGTVEMNYSYVNKSAYSPVNRLSDLNGSEQGLLFAIDLAETTASERQIGEILSLIRDEADAGHITIGRVRDAAAVVKERLAREEANVAAFLETQEARTARIRELEELTREIYSHWKD
ncbi:MAG: hypothetical protein K6G17_09260 [Oscillospiraceae bacterium]|nr:hypothetical protein [Oscillospiraceae bacterium]